MSGIVSPHIWCFLRALRALGGVDILETYVTAIQPNGDAAAFLRHVRGLSLMFFAAGRMGDRVEV